MIAQQLQIVCVRGACLLLAALLGACSSTPATNETLRSAGQVTRAGNNAGQEVGNTVGQQAAQVALRQLGVPYRYGGQSPAGFDCSGLVHYSYIKAGKPVPRTTTALWAGTRPVKRQDMEIGDLVFFSIEGKMSHVGLYIGDDRFVHAPSSGKTVSVQSLSSDFYRAAFLRAGRP